MSAVNERKSRPSIIRCRMVNTVRLNRSKSIESIVMTGSSIGNVKSRRRVIETIWINDIVIDRSGSFVKMGMAVDVKIDIILMHDCLKCGLTVGADGARRGKIPTSVTEDNNPRCDRTVDRCQVVCEPVDLLVVRAERSCIFWTSLIRSNKTIPQIGFSIQHDIMGHSIIVRIPKVANTTRRTAWHTPMVHVSREVELARHTDRRGVFDSRGFVGRPTIITIGFVVSRTNHVSVVDQQPVNGRCCRTYGLAAESPSTSSKNALRMLS